MTGSHILISAAVLMVLGNPGKACAETLHTWHDEDGQVHFSDRAPIGHKSEITYVTSSSGKGSPASVNGLRTTERSLLGGFRRREKAIAQARRRSVSQHLAEKSRCRTARNRYDLAKRKPGAAKSVRVRRYYEEMRTLCR